MSPTDSARDARECGRQTREEVARKYDDFAAEMAAKIADKKARHLALCDDVIARSTAACAEQTAAFVGYYRGLTDLLQMHDGWLHDRSVSCALRTQRLATHSVCCMWVGRQARSGSVGRRPVPR